MKKMNRNTKKIKESKILNDELIEKNKNITKELDNKEENSKRIK